MKKRVVLIMMFLIICVSNTYAVTQQNRWLTFTQAIEKAQTVDNDKPVMLVVYLDSCPVCRSWFSAVNQSQEFFKAINSFVIPAKIEERAFLTLFGSKFVIKTVPAFFFFTKDGLLLTRFEGAPNNPDEFLKFLYKIKNYKELLKHSVKK